MVIDSIQRLFSLIGIAEILMTAMTADSLAMSARVAEPRGAIPDWSSIFAGQLQLQALRAGGNAEIFHSFGNFRPAQLRQLTIDDIGLGVFNFQGNAKGFFRVENGRAAL